MSNSEVRIALTILEILAFNVPTVRLLRTYLQTDAQSDENSITVNSLRSLD